MTTPVATGSEIPVNTYMTLAQRDPSIATLSDGGYVVTWDSNLQDGSQDGVYGQRFDAIGNPVGAEFRVNTTTIGDQTNSEVIGLTGGGFVVTWYDRDQGDGNVYARRYDASGVAQGNEFLVNTETASAQRSPAITDTSDGGFVISWMSFNQDGSNWGVYGQRYNASGVAQGSEFQANTYTTSTQSEPSVTGLAGGGFVVTWQSFGQDGNDFGVYAQRYNASGVAQGLEFRVNTHTPDIQSVSEVTALSGGGFVVTWVSVSFSANPSQDGSGYGIFGQLYDASGNTVGSEFQVNTYTLGTQFNPKITELSDGGFVVVWMSLSQDGDGWGAYGQRYNSSGVAVGNEFQVATTITDDQVDVTVTALANGGFVAAWMDGERFTDTAEIKSHLFSYADAPFNAADNTVTLFGPGQTVDGLGGNDTITGADYEGGSDDISGGDGNDTLLGMAGDDILRGGAGLDILQGGDGDDDLHIDDQDQVIMGGAGYDRLFVEAGSGAVNVTIGSNGIEYAEGGTGGDTFDGSTGSAAVMLFGNGGNDVLVGAGLDDDLDGGDDLDTLFGNGGNDTLTGGDGDDTLNGGDDADTAVYSGSFLNYTVVDNAGVITITDTVGTEGMDTVSNTEFFRFLEGTIAAANLLSNQIVGSAADETLQGTINPDVILGLGGNDTINASDGADSLLGDLGNDTLEGGAGNDIIDGGGDTDTAVYSGSFLNYTVVDNAGVITITDTVGTEGMDTVFNTEFFRFLEGTIAAANLMSNQIVGSAAGETLQGTINPDVILGLGGNDTINASSAGDSLLGGSGDDDLIGGAGADVLDGGSNTAAGDTATYSNSDAAVNINLATGTATGGHADGDHLIDIENLFGSVHADTLTGDGGSNTINGFNGNDTLDGGGGDDTLEGGNGDDTFISSTGADVFSGGTGNDTADYSGSNAGVTVQINNGGTVNGGHATGDTVIVENITGSAFADDLIGDTLANVLTGNDGDDTFNASSGNDTINGGAGDDFILGSRGGDTINGGSNTGVGDTASYSNSDARVVVDLQAGTATGSGHGSGDMLIDIENIFGSLFNDDIFGDGGNNVLEGFNGVDELFGRGGNDTLIGGGGFDFLNGGEGNDTLTGAGGDDRFLFDIANFGVDTITDFTNNRDLMDMRGSGLQFSDLTVTTGATDTVITVTASPTNSITLTGVTSLINSADFIFDAPPAPIMAGLEVPGAIDNGGYLASDPVKARVLDEIVNDGGYRTSDAVIETLNFDDTGGYLASDPVEALVLNELANGGGYLASDDGIETLSGNEQGGYRVGGAAEVVGTISADDQGGYLTSDDIIDTLSNDGQGGYLASDDPVASLDIEDLGGYLVPDTDDNDFEYMM